MGANSVGVNSPWGETGVNRLCHADEAKQGRNSCHCLDDMAVRMCKVLARPWVGV